MFSGDEEKGTRRRALGVAVSHRFFPLTYARQCWGGGGEIGAMKPWKSAKREGAGCENFVCDIGGEYININLCHDSPGYFYKKC